MGLPVIVCLFSVSAFSQNLMLIDSLESLVKTTPDDSIKAAAQCELCKLLSYKDPDKAEKVCKEGLKLAQQIGQKRTTAAYYQNLTTLFANQGKYDIAQKHAIKSLELFEKVGDTSGIAHSNGLLGIVNYQQFRLNKNDKTGARAEKYYLKAADLFLKVGDKQGLVRCYANMATLAEQRELIPLALQNNKKALELAIELGSVYGQALIMNNMGNNYSALGQRDKSLELYKKALVLREKMGDYGGIASSANNIAQFLAEDKDYKDALKYAAKAEAAADSLNDNRAREHIYINYALMYEEMGRYKEALDYSWKLMDVKDSLLSEESNAQLEEMNAKYETVEKEKQLAIKESEIQMSNVLLEQESMKKVGFASGFALMLIMVVIVFNSYRQKRKDNQLISFQKMQVEEKNREITDSIEYARRLQSAILPPQKLVKEYFDNSFILYRPKDIVAGDFYWMETAKETVMFAVADCTGHGVPGAMVSVVCSNALKKSVNELGLTDPASILNATRDEVIETFEKSEEDVKDGMDIALCAYNTKTGTLFFAGANNPLYIIKKNDGQEEQYDIRNETHYLIEIKGDKQPVGKYAEHAAFNAHQVDVTPGDSIYMFTDGFADQFGGDRGKKFKYKPFKKLLLKNHQLPMQQQKEQLEIAFNSWKGDLDQIDDVCVIGVRV